METIVSQGFDKIYGARPLKRYIQKYIETPLAKAIIEGKVKEKTNISVDYKDNEFVFNPNK